MAENGVALTEVREQVHRLRGSLRRVDQALARFSDGAHVGVIAFDADVSVDEELVESVVDLMEDAAEEHPGCRIEVTVTAHQGTDREESP